VFKYFEQCELDITPLSVPEMRSRLYTLTYLALGRTIV